MSVSMLKAGGGQVNGRREGLLATWQTKWMGAFLSSILAQG